MDQRNMNFDDSGEPFTPGTLVRIRNSGFGRGRVAEYRGPLGPKGARVYRVRVRKKPYEAYTEVLESQLELIPPKSAAPTEDKPTETS